MPNIEIKARFDNPQSAHQTAQRLGATLVGVDHQTDTYFCAPNGRLKLRESSLSGTSLIPYSRPNTSGPKRSEYAVIPIEEAQKVKALLAQILGIETVVTKARTLYLLDNVRIHIDEVEELGSFFEFEAVYNSPEDETQEIVKVESLIREFAIPPTNLLTGSYRELRQKQQMDQNQHT